MGEMVPTDAEVHEAVGKLWPVVEGIQNKAAALMAIMAFVQPIMQELRERLPDEEQWRVEALVDGVVKSLKKPS